MSSNPGMNVQTEEASPALEPASETLNVEEPLLDHGETEDYPQDVEMADLAGDNEEIGVPGFPSRHSQKLTRKHVVTAVMVTLLLILIPVLAVIWPAIPDVVVDDWSVDDYSVSGDIWFKLILYLKVTNPNVVGGNVEDVAIDILYKGQKEGEGHAPPFELLPKAVSPAVLNLKLGPNANTTLGMVGDYLRNELVLEYVAYIRAVVLGTPFHITKNGKETFGFTLPDTAESPEKALLQKTNLY